MPITDAATDGTVVPAVCVVENLQVQ